MHFNVYHVDTAQFGITEGMIEKGSNGHYTEAQYDIMYNNAVGFTRAFEYAHDNGYTKVIIPHGDYCFTPIFNAEKAVSMAGCIPNIIWILNISDLEIDMNGSTFHLMVDSTEHSKYYRYKRDNNDTKQWRYLCNLIGIGQSKNITIRNGKFRGDIYTRSLNDNGNYYDYDEKSQEGCYGITVGISAFTHNISLIDLDGSGFTGDFISSYARSLWVYEKPFWDGLYNTNNTGMKLLPINTIKGLMNYGKSYKYGSSEIETASDTSSRRNNVAVSGIYDIGAWFDAGYEKFGIVEEVSKREFSLYTPGGYTRLPNCYGPLIQVITYSDEPTSIDDKPLRIINTGYCESFQLFKNERYVRLQFLNETGLKAFKVEGTTYIPAHFYRSTSLADLDEVNDYFKVNLTQQDIEDGLTNLPNQMIVDDEEAEGQPTSSDDISEDVEDVYQYEESNNDAGGIGPKIAIVPKLNHTLLIEGCKIHDNGRGGIQGGMNDVVIRRCEFMKQQYSKTSGAQGAHPVFSIYGTNYHISHEDVVSKRLTVENCVFYSGRNTGKLLFPTIIQLDFRNNVCYGCIPSVGNNFVTNICGNVFHDTSISSTYDNWMNDSSGTASASKFKMTRVMNYVNNTYYNCKAPKYNVYPNTTQNFHNCFIEINDIYDVSPESSAYFLSGKKPNCVFDGCYIKFLRNATAYFPRLINSKIEGGTECRVGYMENCELNDSIVYIVGGLRNAEDTTIHMYVKSVRGLDLRSHCSPPLTSKRKTEDGVITDPRLNYVVHYDDCEIDVSKIDRYLFNNLRLSTEGVELRWYNSVKLEFNNCRFIGSASNVNLDSGDAEHISYAIFNNCSFDLDTSYLFGGTVGTNYRYFEFNDCTFSTEGFTLGTSAKLANFVCGGNAGTNRPMLTKQGSVYFDTSLNNGAGKPIWRVSEPMTLAELNQDGVEFVDATGTIV